MGTYTNHSPAGSKDLYELSRGFFRFPENDPIKIVLPTVARKRHSTLNCRNYPLFDCEVSPDDVLSAMRIYSLLVVSYRSRVDVEFPKATVVAPANAVFIGGPATNTFVSAIAKSFPIHFDIDSSVRLFHGTQGDYEIGFSPGTARQRSITRDYCIVTKCCDGAGAKFVIGGLRAYGQLGSNWFLSNPDFYHQTRNAWQGDDFQILVSIDVSDRVCSRWEIVEQIDTVRPRSVFLSYVHEDADTIQRIQKDLEQRGIRVWKDTDSIKGSERWRVSIENGIRACDYFMPCFSKQAASPSNYMLTELEKMRSEDWNRQGKRDGNNWIIPVRIEECDIPDFPIAEKHRNLRDIQWIDLFEPKGWEAGIKEILRIVWKPKNP